MTSITLGILGGGQLGRMSALAAARLGIKVIIYTPETNAPASQVVAETIIGDYHDERALSEFAGKVDMISYEFENIPLETVRYLKTLKPVYPDEQLLEIAQDRIAEKTYLNRIGIPTARWAAPKTPDDVREALKTWGAQECILKTTRFGYDGKGQARCGLNNIDTVWSGFNSAPLIMEEIVDFDCEISVILARDLHGRSQTYGPMRNVHKHHILDRSFVPAGLPPAIEEESLKMAHTLADSLNLTGVLTLELFLTKDGGLLANEIAPRTHNSGHWSIDACAVSQFENHVRSVCGLPVGAPARHSSAEMINIIGDDIHDIEKHLDISGNCVHIYGKPEPRRGRKMGHVTILKPR